jgi:hypothetical protein
MIMMIMMIIMIMMMMMMMMIMIIMIMIMITIIIVVIYQMISCAKAASRAHPPAPHLRSVGPTPGAQCHGVHSPARNPVYRLASNVHLSHSLFPCTSSSETAYVLFCSLLRLPPLPQALSLHIIIRNCLCFVLFSSLSSTSPTASFPAYHHQKLLMFCFVLFFVFHLSHSLFPCTSSSETAYAGQTE